MAEARLEHSDRLMWNHTSAVMALVHNIHRDPRKSGPKRPDSFNPYARRSKPIRVSRKQGFNLLKQTFMKG